MNIPICMFMNNLFGVVLIIMNIPICMLMNNLFGVQ